jgi:hypothetical protein
MAGDGRQVMARKSDPLSDSFGTDDADGWLGGIIADEDELDRLTLWRLGLWGFAAVGALTLGLLSSQLPVNAQRTQLAANEITGRASQVETSLQENQLESRRLAAAIDTLNGDRDRLFSRLSSLEQGLDVVTGSIRKADERPTAVPWPDVVIAPIIESAPATIPLAPPAAAAQPAAAAPASEGEPAPIVIAAREPPAEAPSPPPPAAPSAVQAMPIPDALPQPAEADARPADELPVTLAEFGVDLGAANSIGGLRALWRGLVKSHKAQLHGLRPLISVHERRNGLGLQLRLIAGPIRDAAAAARICAVMSDADRDCKTTTFEGQRLSLASEGEQKAAPAVSRPQARRKSTRVQQPPPPPPARAAEASTLSTLLGIR